MSRDIEDLYKSQILTSAKDDTHFGELTEATHILEAYNPMCGDKYTLYIELKEAIVRNASFKGYGCAISKASTAILIKKVIGKSIMEVHEIVAQFLSVIDKETNIASEEITQDPEMLAFSGARVYEERKKCASLSWEELSKFI